MRPDFRGEYILIVEDNRADVFLLREALAAAGIEAQIKTVPDGEKAIQFFDSSDADDQTPCPSLVILDLNLPRKTGGEVLEYLRHTRRCRNVGVLIMTSSDSESDRVNTTRLGANGYFRKPSDYGEFMKIGGVVRKMLTDAQGLSGAKS